MLDYSTAKSSGPASGSRDVAVITVTGMAAAGGREIADAVASRLGFRLYGDAPADLDLEDHSVVLGLGAPFLFKDRPRCLHARIVAPLAYRVARLMRMSGLDRDAAARRISEEDDRREAFALHMYTVDWRDPLHYDLILNADRMSTDAAAGAIARAAAGKGIVPMQSMPVALPSVGLPESDLTFPHPSEREFARVMNFYRIRWQYEPRSFPIEWDVEGNVVQSFTPDFYLPDLDLYVELTTMKQTLVTRKNRKVRRLRELYPEIRVKVLYEKDYKHLLWKYGLTDSHA